MLIYCVYTFIKGNVHCRHHTEMPSKFSAYQRFLREQILFSPSDHYQEDPPAENICSNTPANCDQQCKKLKKNKLIEQKCKFIQDMFLILSNIALKDFNIVHILYPVLLLTYNTEMLCLHIIRITWFSALYKDLMMELKPRCDEYVNNNTK
jgi:hypothetical protein